MVHLIPVQLGTFIVLIPEQQRTSAFKEQPTIPESCVVAQKCCGFRVIKGLLRIITTRWPHRTYKEQDKKVSKHSFFFFKAGSTSACVFEWNPFWQVIFWKMGSDQATGLSLLGLERSCDFIPSCCTGKVDQIKPDQPPARIYGEWGGQK